MRPQRKLSCYLNLEHLHSAEHNFLQVTARAIKGIKEIHSRPDHNIEALFKRLALVGTLNDQLDAVMSAWQWGTDIQDSSTKARRSTSNDSRFDLAQIVRAEEDQFCQVVQVAIQQIQAVPAEDEPNFNNHFLLRYMVIGWLSMQVEAALSVWDEPTAQMVPVMQTDSQRSGQPLLPRPSPKMSIPPGPERHERIMVSKANTHPSVQSLGIYAQDLPKSNASVDHPRSPQHVRRMSSSLLEIGGHRLPRSMPALDSQHRHHNKTHSGVDSEMRPLKRPRRDDRNDTPSKQPTSANQPEPGSAPITRAFRPPPPLPVPSRPPEVTVMQGSTSPSAPSGHDDHPAPPDARSSPNSTASSGSAFGPQRLLSRTNSRNNTRSKSTEGTDQEPSTSDSNKSDSRVCKFAYPYPHRSTRPHREVYRDSHTVASSPSIHREKPHEDVERPRYESDVAEPDNHRPLAIDSDNSQDHLSVVNEGQPDAT